MKFDEVRRMNAPTIKLIDKKIVIVTPKYSQTELSGKKVIK